MAESKKYPHQNHRQRVRKAFIETDRSQISDLNLLEFLLFYSIPRCDTKGTAENLLKKYKTLKGVFDAPFDELCAFPGLGESSALLLSTMNEFSLRAENGSLNAENISESEITERLAEIFRDKSTEIFVIAVFDVLGRLTGIVPLGEGDENSVEIRKRELLESAFSLNADSVIIAHNHPSTVAAPSKQDMLLTEELKALFSQMQIKLINHCIFGTDGMISLKDTENGRRIFD